VNNADITDGNPNVAYELGLADAIGRQVVLVSQMRPVPFDFTGQRVLEYDYSQSGLNLLEIRLLERLQSLQR
jgi:hypothetical protein